jgi:hypothetical protein
MIEYPDGLSHPKPHTLHRVHEDLVHGQARKPVGAALLIWIEELISVVSLQSVLSTDPEITFSILQ